MRVTMLLLAALALAPLGGCGQRSAADRVERYYDRKADRLDRIAAGEHDPRVAQIYRDRAAALRQEGQAREQGLREAGADHVPRLSNIEEALDAQPNTTATGTAENSARREAGPPPVSAAALAHLSPQGSPQSGGSRAPAGR